MDFSPARTRRATSSSVRFKHALSYVAFMPARARRSRVAARWSGEQKQRYACPDWRTRTPYTRPTDRRR